VWVAHPSRSGTCTLQHSAGFSRHTQTLGEWAAESSRHAFGAQVSSPQQREQGKAHQAAGRAWACKWRRILYRCWQERTPYDVSRYLPALKRRNAPLLHTLATVS
jgi:hypothetical protein